MGKWLKIIFEIIIVVGTLCGIIIFSVDYLDLKSNKRVLEGKVETLEKANYELKGERDGWKEHYIELIEKMASQGKISWDEVKQLLSEEDLRALNYNFGVSTDRDKATASEEQSNINR
jgi:hypothetical protein